MTDPAVIAAHEWREIERLLALVTVAQRREVLDLLRSQLKVAP